MSSVNNGTVQIRCAEWPSFLYDEEVKYDSNNEENGLLKGPLLVRVCYLALFHIHMLIFSQVISTYIYWSNISPSWPLHWNKAIKGPTASFDKGYWSNNCLCFCSGVPFNFHFCDVNGLFLLNRHGLHFVPLKGGTSVTWILTTWHFTTILLDCLNITLMRHGLQRHWIGGIGKLSHVWRGLLTTIYCISNVPGLKPHLKRKRQKDQEPNHEDNDAVKRIFAQRKAHRQKVYIYSFL
jgi:hypothetical protein